MPTIPTITYREAALGDMAALAKLRWKMEIEAGNDAVDPEEYLQAYSTSVRNEIEGRRHRAWLAEVDRQAVACVLLIWWTLPPNFDSFLRKRGFVSSVYTEPAFRRQGIARQLMNLLIASAREEGIGRLILWSSEMGRPLYEELGFTGSHALELRL
ncbi:MAG: GNAT family N-acetyltransferase [Ktedonobacterales bacterium]